MASFEFQGRTAVITGAGSGLGLAFAHEAARRGMKLVLADVDAEALETASAALRAAGTEVESCVVDVRRPEALTALRDAAVARFGAPHLVFNNAGVGAGGLTWETTVEDWRWVLDVNLWGVIHGVHTFVPTMIAAGRDDPDYRGHIVNTASMAGLLNPPNMGVYNVSKEAVVSLSESLYHDLDLVEAPVGVSVLCPFFVPTRIFDSDRLRDAPAVPRTRSQEVGHLLGQRAVESGRVSAEQVAALTFDGVAEGRFYLYSHPQALDGVRERGAAMVSAEGRPADPFAHKPQLRDALRQQLLGTGSAV